MTGDVSVAGNGSRGKREYKSLIFKMVMNLIWDFTGKPACPSGKIAFPRSCP
jgi:hypothetical protein